MPPIHYWQGRKAELAQIQEWLNQDSIVLVGITGLGGFGKSTLAAKLLDESASLVKFWADVRTGTDFSSLARRVLTAWGMAAEQVQAIPELNLTDALVRRLQEQPGLLVIDNVESLLDEAGEWQNPVYQQFLQQWIEVGAQSKLLLTSRERPTLEARRTRWYALVNGLSATEGAALLQDLGIRGEAAELEALVTQVGGYPLSLMLVAGLLLAEEELDPQVRYLPNYGKLFQIRGLHHGENQASVEQIFGWSFARLSPTLQHLLTQISVFRRAFNVTAAAALVPDAQITEADLRQLVRRSLLQELPRDKTAQRQFQLQPQVRELVQQRADDLTAAHQRAIEYYWTIAQSESWQELDDVAEYLEIFYHHCELQQYAEAFTTLLDSGCDDFLELRGYNLERTQLYHPIVEQWQNKWQFNDAERQDFGEMLNRLGCAYYLLRLYRPSVEFYNRYLKIAREIGDREAEADALGNLGNVYDVLGWYDLAVKSHERALEIGNKQGEAASLGNLGNAYHSLGQYQQAIKFHQQALEIAQQTGDGQVEANALGNLGRAYNALHKYRRAIKFLQQWLKISREIGYKQGEANALSNLGEVLEKLGQAAEAKASYQQARELYAAMGVQDDRCKGRLQQLETVPRKRSWVQRFVAWLWRQYQRLWLWVNRFR